ncbi:MAG: FAD:protein FMN transferase [Chlamydiales bacterium]|nr:FAD:protein FMN transferase [Chlamydiales bacterium]
MTMAYTVKIGDPDPDLSLAESIILSTFSEINALYNNWNPHSEISKLNRLPAGVKYPLSPQLAAFLRQIDRIVSLTEQRFDPTVAPVKESLLKGEIQSETAAVGWDKIHLEGDLFWKEYDQTALDLGGAAKGYAVDLILEQLQEAGFRNLFVEWGGEIRAAGSHPEGRPWKVAILGGETLELHEEAIATSGSYLQNWTVGEAQYTHIIDPKTKLPLSDPSITSASVVTRTCFEADALATALMLFSSQQEAYEWAKARGLKIWLF